MDDKIFAWKFLRSGKWQRCVKYLPVCITEGQSPGVVSVDGGRYDIDVEHRVRRPVYWDECDSVVRRCSWFYRSDADSRLIPYDEEFAVLLEVRSENSNSIWLDTRQIVCYVILRE